MSILDSLQMKQVVRFIDGLNKLANDTGVTIFADMSNAQIHLDNEETGLRLVDTDAYTDGYSLEVSGG